MRLRSLVLLLLLAPLLPAAPAQAATSYVFQCPPAPGDDGTTHWTGGGNSVNATRVSGSVGAWSVSCGYSGSSLDGELHIYRPDVGAVFYDETATSTYTACYRPGRTESGTRYSSTAQASARRNADELYDSLEGARNSLLVQAEAYAAPCPPIRCPYDFDGDWLLNDLVDRLSFGRWLLSCHYRPPAGSGPSIVFALSWLNTTTAATASASSFTACTGRSLPDNNVTREGFEVYAYWRWDRSSTTDAFPAGARAFAASLFPLATDVAECPDAVKPTPTTTASVTTTPTPSAVATPSPAAPVPFPCPTSWHSLGAESPRLLKAYAPALGIGNVTMSAWCRYSALPGQTDADTVEGGQMYEITWVPRGKPLPESADLDGFTVGFCGRITLREEAINSGTYMATARVADAPDEDIVAFTRFLIDQLLPLAESRAEECPFGSGADQLEGKPCGVAWSTDVSPSYESPMLKWPPDGSEGFECEFKDSGERRETPAFAMNLTWQLEGTSVPHWACAAGNATGIVPFQGYQMIPFKDAYPGIGVAIGFVSAQPTDTATAIALRLLHFYRHHAAACPASDIASELAASTPWGGGIAVMGLMAAVAIRSTYVRRR